MGETSSTEPQPPQSNSTSSTPNLVVVLYRCVVAQDFTALHDWFVGSVEHLKRAWQAFAFIAVLVAYGVWWVIDHAAEASKNKLNQEHFATIQTLNDEHLKAIKGIEDKLSTANERIKQLDNDMDRNKRDAETKVAQLTADFNEAKRERDSKIEQLLVENGNLQSKLGYYQAVSPDAIKAIKEAASDSRLDPDIIKRMQAVVDQLQAAGKTIQNAASGLPRSNAHWDITDEQAQKLKSILSPLAGTKIDIAAQPTDQEGTEFAIRLADIFTSAGWVAGRNAVLDMRGQWKGVFIQMSSKDVSDDLKTRLIQAGGHLSVGPGDVPVKAAIVAGALKNILNVDCHYDLEDSMQPGEMELRIGKRVQ